VTSITLAESSPYAGGVRSFVRPQMIVDGLLQPETVGNPSFNLTILAGLTFVLVAASQRRVRVLRLSLNHR
jgi:hypothetical protein